MNTLDQPVSLQSVLLQLTESPYTNRPLVLNVYRIIHRGKMMEKDFDGLLIKGEGFNLWTDASGRVYQWESVFKVDESRPPSEKVYRILAGRSVPAGLTDR